MEIAIPWILSVIGSLWIGSYFSPYLKKRAENLATHDDLDKLLAQMRATTEATKAIEARIDDQVWNKQRQWEMKRDVLLGFARTISDFEQSVLNLSTKIENRSNSPQEMENFRQALVRWNEASAKFVQDSFTAGLVISSEARSWLGELTSTLRNATSDILRIQTVESYKAHHRDIVAKLENFRTIIGKELGLPQRPS
jgi:hypothetical protein